MFDDFFSLPAKEPPSLQSPPKSRMQPISRQLHNDPFPEFSPTKEKEKDLPPPPSIPEEEHEDEDFAPVATELRKRLAEKGSQSTGAAISDDEVSPKPKDSKSKTRKGKKKAIQEGEDDEVIASARERKRIAQEESKKAAEEFAAAVQDHAHLRNLGVVETYHVDLIPRPLNREDRSTRWNPMWNGRKNFKKFRKVKQSISVTVGKEMIKLVDYEGANPASQGRFFSSVINALDLFFATPTMSANRGNTQNDAGEDSLLDELDMEPSLGKSSRSSKQSSRTIVSTRSSNRSSNLSTKPKPRYAHDSDDDLGFDSS
jgi:hypothetical protein